MESGVTPLQHGRLCLGGASASAIKYDVLTALLALSASGQGTPARLALRLSLLITARFNWQRGTFKVGQREMARMWHVTERTAKREMSALRDLGWIAVSVPAARGRVAEYEIVFTALLRSTEPHWASVGPDFEARMLALSGTTEAPQDTNVVPLRPANSSNTEGAHWPSIAAHLAEQDPALFSAWFSGLREVEAEAGLLTLSAPSRFVAGYVETHFRSRLLAAVTLKHRGLRDVRVVAPN